MPSAFTAEGVETFSGALEADDRGVILPKKGLAELKKLLAEAAESGEEQPEAKLGFVENSAIFRRPNVEFCAISPLGPRGERRVETAAGSHASSEADQSPQPSPRRAG